MSSQSQGETRIMEGPLAAARLRELGLREEILVQAVHAAEMDRRGCSIFEPASAPGYKSWAAAVGTLGELLVPTGWIKEETRGLPRLVNPKNGIAIAVVHGDEGVGLLKGRPKSKQPRGEQSISLIESNQLQLTLPFPGMPPPPPAPVVHEQLTYWLLIYSDTETVRAELSLAVGLSDDGRLAVWEERILVGIPDFYIEPFRKNDDDEPQLPVEVVVRPK
jgi:hypothetical protein